MRKLTIIPAALLLAGCAAPAQTTGTPAPTEQVEPTAPVGDVPTAFPMDVSHLEEPPTPGPNTVTITAYTSTDGTAHWGHKTGGGVAELTEGVTWSTTVENVDASEYWDVTVFSDMSGNDTASCSIAVDGYVISEETTEGVSASAWCTIGELSF